MPGTLPSGSVKPACSPAEMTVPMVSKKSVSRKARMTGRSLPESASPIPRVKAPTVEKSGMATTPPSEAGSLLIQATVGCAFAHCTYCIIPELRPRLWTKPVGEVVEEARRLVAAGHQETEHPPLTLGLMVFRKNLRPVRRAGSWVGHFNILFRLKDLHRSFLLW